MNPVVYIHVPKCGGSSFGAALRLRAFPSQATIPLTASRRAALRDDPSLTGEALIRADYAHRTAALSQALAVGKTAIAAHVPYAPDLHAGVGRSHLWVTLLRDPVARFASHYHYLQRAHPDPRRPSTLSAFCDAPDALRIGSQILFYFSGDWIRPGIHPSAQIMRAKRALAACDLVGRLEDADTFRRDLSQRVGTSLPMLFRNKAPAPPDLSRSLRRRIETICAADLELFESRDAGRSAA